MIVDLWLDELKGDEDEAFLRDGLVNGFQLVPADTVFLPAEMQNYKSATNSNVKDKVEQVILEEIESGNYVIINNQHTIVSAIGAVPKPDSDDVRLMHDCA